VGPARDANGALATGADQAPGDLEPVRAVEFDRAAQFPRGFGNYALELFGIGLAYFILAKIGLALASIHPSASPIWPPTGLALAAVMFRGYRIWPAIFLGA
jgi:hypothetical protein